MKGKRDSRGWLLIGLPNDIEELETMLRWEVKFATNHDVEKRIRNYIAYLKKQKEKFTLKIIIGLMILFFSEFQFIYIQKI